MESSFKIVNVALPSLISAPLLLELKLNEKLSSLSTRLSSIVRMPTSLLLSPAAKLTVEFGATKSKPAKAVPLLADKLRMGNVDVAGATDQGIQGVALIALHITD